MLSKCSMYLFFLYTLTPPCRPQKWERIFQLRLVPSFLCYSINLLASVSTYLRDTTLRNSASVTDKIVSCSLHPHVSLFSKIWAHSNLVGILLASQKILQYLISIHVNKKQCPSRFILKPSLMPKMSVDMREVDIYSELLFNQSSISSLWWFHLSE